MKKPAALTLSLVLLVAILGGGLLLLRRPPVYSGTVTILDPNGSPLAGVPVQVAGSADLSKTDSTGRLVVGGLQAGRHKIQTAHPQLINAIGYLNPPTRTSLILRLERRPVPPPPTPPAPPPQPAPTEACVRGRVIDGMKGSPVAGSKLYLFKPPAQDRLREVNLPPTGEFALVAPPGSYLLVAFAPGFIPARQTVDLKAGEQTISLAIQESGGLQGSVLNAGHDYVSKLQIRLTGPAGDTTMAPVGGDRIFRFDALAPGHYVLDLVVAGQPRKQDVPAEVVAATVTQVDLEAPEGTLLQGTVRILEQRPPRRLQLSFIRNEDGEDGEFALELDDQDTYRLRAIPPGTYDFKAELPSLGRWRGGVTIGPGTAYTMDIELGGSSLSGRIARKGGTGIPAVAVSLYTVKEPGKALGSDALAARAVSDEQGRYTIGGLQEGSYLLVAQADGRTISKPVELKAGKNPLDLEVGAGATLNIRVVTGGRSVAECWVIVRPLPGLEWTQQATTDAEGRATLEGLPPGLVQVTATTERGRQTRTVTLPDAGSVAVELSFD